MKSYASYVHDISVKINLAPSEANSFAVSNPNPDPAPVIKTTVF